MNTSEEGFGKGERRNRLREISRLLSVVVALGEGDILIEGRTEGRKDQQDGENSQICPEGKVFCPHQSHHQDGHHFFFSDHVFFRARSSGHPQPAWDLEC